MDRKVKIWEITNSGPELRGVLTGANASIQSVDFDAGASLVLAASSDFATRVWTMEDHRLRVSD
jgi:autophagy-related protein 16